MRGISAERWQRIEELYHAALACGEQARDGFLADACGADEALLQEVEALIRQSTSTSDLLGGSAPVPAQCANEVGASLPTGGRLGAYHVHECIGRGGMGEVYRAHDPRLRREVAIKILRSDLSLHDRARRFEREAQAIASLNHPHICILFDVGEQDGVTYLVFEYVKGPTLQQHLREKAPLSLTETLQIAGEVGDALREAHRHGILHRDIKPGNIKLTERGAKLLDFGLARNFEPIDSSTTNAVTSGGVVLGTPWYMSPEQALGQPVDARSDIFSLGVVIYEMLSGCRPFDGANAIETIDAVLHKHPEPLATLNPSIPPELEHIVTRCLEKDRERRYPAVDDVLTDLINVTWEGAKSLPMRSRAMRRHNLPLELTSFIGREREVAELHSVLELNRLLTLSGTGGCGKTRLALRVASNLIDNYPDGVWFVELAPVSNHELVLQSVASAFRLQEEQQARPLLQRLLDYLEARQLLIVLDNCEHVVAAVAQLVAAVLTSCGRIKVLATSREPLRVAGERVWRVPPLALPDSASVGISQLSQYEAIRLFIERSPDFPQLDQNDANRVVEICRRLDGIPLAIEMAAARLDVLSLQQISERLNDRFSLLAGPERTRISRQETLTSVINWSHDLLTPEEQILFRRVAVFAGSFSLEAAETVCADKRLRSEDVLAILSRLVEKSMVTLTRTSLGVRYRLLETLLEYGGTKLRRAPEERRTRSKHADFFLDLLEGRPEAYSSERVPWFARLEQEHQNVLAALEWCNAAGHQPQTALRLANALSDFWWARGYYQLGKEVLLRALQCDRTQMPEPVLIEALNYAGDFFSATGELHAARLVYEDSLGLAEASGNRAAVGRTFIELGGLAMTEGKYVDADDLLRKGLEISRTHGSTLDVPRALTSLGIIAFLRSDHERAESYWQQSEEIYRELAFEPGLTSLLTFRAALANDRADYNKAEALCTEALAIARRTGESAQVAHALIELGCKYALCDYHRSRAVFEEALAIARDAGDKRRIAVTLSFLSDISCDEGHYSEAGRLLDEASAIFTQMHEDRSPNASICLRSMASLAFEQGLFDKALDLCERILSFESSGARRDGVLQLLGWVRLAQGDHVGARAAFEERLRRAQETGRSSLLAGSQLGIAHLEMLEGHVEEAEPRLQTALSVYEAGNHKSGQVNALLALGDAALLQNRTEQSEGLYLRALGVARDLGFKKGLVRAVRAIGMIAAKQHQPEVAARYFGAGGALLAAINGHIPSFQAMGYEVTLDAVRSEIGSKKFQRLWDEGAALPIDRMRALFEENLPS